MGKEERNSRPATLTFFTQSPRRRLNRSRDQFLTTILPVQDSRSSYSWLKREEAILSVRMKSGADVLFGVGAVVDVRRESRTWEPVVESASWRIGDWSDVVDGVGGNRRLLVSFLRKGMGLLGVGERADWMMWEVVVYIAKASNVSCGNASKESWIRVAGGPGIESMVCANKEPWSCDGVGFGGSLDGGKGSEPSVVNEGCGRRREMSSMNAIFNTKVSGLES